VDFGRQNRPEIHRRRIRENVYTALIGPGNGSPSAANVVFLFEVVVKFSKY